MLAEQQGARATVLAVVTEREAQTHPFVADLARRGVAVEAVVLGARDYVREYRALGAYVESHRPDVVHTHGYRPDVIASAAARRRGSASVSTVHGFTGGGARDRLYEYLQVRAMRRMHAVIAVSTPLRARLVASGVPHERVHVVSNAYAPSGLLLSRAAARERLGVPGDARIAGWVGRLSREKGADIMLRALAAAGSEWQLAVVGDGPERHMLEALAAELGIAKRVRWCGLVPDAGTLLAAFDVFALSSRTEGTPIVLLEAMAAGVPIVASRVGGVPDVVRDTEAELVPPEDPGAIAAALALVATAPERTLSRVEAARARVILEYAPARWVSAVDQVYHNAIQWARRT